MDTRNLFEGMVCCNIINVVHGDMVHVRKTMKHGDQFGTMVPSIRYSTPFCACCARVNNVERSYTDDTKLTSFIPMIRTPSSKVTFIHSGESGFERGTGVKATSFSSCRVSYDTGASDKEMRDLT